jgi:SET domain-containing protein
MGKGVRAIKHIPKNTPIGCYMGTVKHQSEIRKSDDWRYNFFYALKDYTIDGSNCDSIMSLINHSDKPNIQVSHHLHSIGNPSKPVEEVHIVFITKTDIEPYTELFIDYGEDYWKASKLMGINKQIEQPNTHKQKLITDYFIKKRLRDYETSPNKITKT